MPAFDFPNNPAVGDQAPGAGGITYVWDGVKWANGTVIPVGGGEAQTPWLSNIDGAGHTLNNAGRIGIGVTNPATALEVVGDPTAFPNGQIFWRDHPGHTGALYVDAANVGFGSVSANNLIFYTANGPVQMVLTTAGNLGIGTSPISLNRLQIRTGLDQNLGIGTPAAIAGAVRVEAGNDAWNANTPLEIRASTTGFTQGNVYIGGGLVEGTFTVNGPAYIHNGNHLVFRPAGDSWNMDIYATGTQLNIVSGGDPGHYIASFINGQGTQLGGITQCVAWGQATDPVNYAQLILRENSFNPAYGLYLSYMVTNRWVGSIQAVDANAGTYLVLNANGGYVGINNNNPAYNLDVAGNINIRSPASYCVDGTKGVWGSWSVQIPGGSASFNFIGGILWSVT